MSAGREALRVFVSSTSLDLTEERQLVARAIRKRSWVALLHEDWAASGEPSVAACRDSVASADLLIVIVGDRHGWQPPVDQGGDGSSSITRLEVLEARRRGIPVLAFLTRTAAPDQPAALAAFRTELEQGIARRFGDRPELELAVTEALGRHADLERGRQHARRLWLGAAAIVCLAGAAAGAAVFVVGRGGGSHPAAGARPTQAAGDDGGGRAPALRLEGQVLDPRGQPVIAGRVELAECPGAPPAVLQAGGAFQLALPVECADGPWTLVVWHDGRRHEVGLAWPLDAGYLTVRLPYRPQVVRVTVGTDGMAMELDLAPPGDETTFALSDGVWLRGGPDDRAGWYLGAAPPTGGAQVVLEAPISDRELARRLKSAEPAGWALAARVSARARPVVAELYLERARGGGSCAELARKRELVMRAQQLGSGSAAGRRLEELRALENARDCPQR